LTFSFSSSDFADAAADASKKYKLELFSDATCKNLVVSWVAGNTTGNDRPGANWAAKYGSPAFIFSGLDGGTEYYFKATDLSTGAVSDVISGKTEQFSVVEMAADGTAEEGDVILAEDFSELVWGGSLMEDENAAGYSSHQRDSLNSLVKATGENELNTTSGDTQFFVCHLGQNMGLFNTLRNAIPNTRLANWGVLLESESTPGALCALAGHLQLGASSKGAEIVTPELSSLKGTATVEVSFTAQGESTDLRHMVIEVLDNASVSGLKTVGKLK
jgi:hypothetical protein